MDMECGVKLSVRQSALIWGPNFILPPQMTLHIPLHNLHVTVGQNEQGMAFFTPSCSNYNTNCVFELLKTLYS